jgi:GNAT superfamily N-acetyltransferase
LTQLTSGGVQVRAKTAADQDWIDALLKERWGSALIVVHGATFDAGTLPALVAGEREGLATYDPGRGELVTLDALALHRGVGTALVEALATLLRDAGHAALRVTTTNDNLDALRFYQRRGFAIVAVRRGAVDEARKLKPTIPILGDHGIPLRDELELERALAE